MHVQHRIKFDPQRIVGFISGGCGGGGEKRRSARADWTLRTCNASLRETAAATAGGVRAASGGRPARGASR